MIRTMIILVLMILRGFSFPRMHDDSAVKARWKMKVSRLI